MLNRTRLLWGLLELIKYVFEPIERFVKNANENILKSLLQQYPQDFYAFFGVSQVVNVIQEEKLSYQFTLEQARTRHINKAIRQLEKIGGPVNGEYASSADLRIQRKWLLRLGGERFDKQNFTDHILTTLFSREYTVFDLFKCLHGIKFSNQHLNETLQAVDFLNNDRLVASI